MISEAARTRKITGNRRRNTATVGPEGQIIIPANVRKRYDLKEGTTIVFQEDRGRLTLALTHFDAILALAGSLRGLPLEEDLEKERKAESDREDRR